MRSDRLIAGCDRIVEIGWLLIALAVPLYFNVYSSRVFEPDKVALFRSVVLVMGCAALIGRIERRTGAAPGGAKPGGVFLLVLALAGVWLLATAASLSPRISLWGSYEWRQGSYTFLCYLALFCLVARGLRSGDRRPRLVTALLFTSLPVSTYGIAQYLGLDPLPWRSVAAGRAISTLGHPNFLGAYLVMVAPLTAVRLLTTTGTAGKRRYAGLLFVQGLCLLLTFSRSSWLAAVGGGLAFVFLLARMQGRARLFWRTAAAAVAVAALVSVLAYADPGGVFSYSPFEPLHSLLRGKSAAARIRTLEWQAVPRLIAARPLLGFGPDTFPLAFSRVYPPELAIYGGPRATGDHAHNELLDSAVSVGLVGTALYLAVVIAILWQGLRALPRATGSDLRLLLIGLSSAVVAYALQHQLSFVTVTPAALLWLYLGLIVAAGGRAEPPPEPVVAPVPARRLAVYSVLAAATLALIAVTNVRPVLADVYARQGAALAGESRWDDSIAAYERALRLAPRQDRYYALLARSYLGTATEDDAAFGRAEAALSQAVRSSPYDLDYHLALGELYYRWGMSSDAARLDLALAAYRRAVELSPTDPRVYVGWGRVHQAQRQYAAAIERYNAALALNPYHVSAYTALGNVYSALGQVERANEAYDEARRAGEVVDRLISKR